MMNLMNDECDECDECRSACNLKILIVVKNIQKIIACHWISFYTHLFFDKQVTRK
jgi:hypothetical protein